MNIFDLSGKVAVVTGGDGLLGRHHCDILRHAGATVHSLDVKDGFDITCEADIRSFINRYGACDILINNAANNPQPNAAASDTRLENFTLASWHADIAVGLTGAFLCSRIFGSEMEKRGRGVIVNICSDLAVIAPDQRLYRVDALPESEQPVKPITYSVVKHGLLGMTRYLATYWKHVRCNAISPGGVENGQSDIFLSRVKDRIPMGRMARPDEYEGAILFLCSDASSYMNGANLVMDGGRSCW